MSADTGQGARIGRRLSLLASAITFTSTGGAANTETAQLKVKKKK